MLPPYPINKNSETGVYEFTTDDNVVYYCVFFDYTDAFPPILAVYDIEVYDFSFYPHYPAGYKKRADARVVSTLSALIANFFGEGLRVMAYTLDTSDDRHAGRNVLFENCYKARGEHFLERDALDFDREGRSTIHACALYKRDFPHIHLLQENMTQEAFEILAQKHQ